jgi:hypothetical protein
MKHFIVILIACAVFCGFIFAQEQVQEQKTPNELIVGKWKNVSNVAYEFTADHEVLVNGKQYATFRFLENVLVLTYLGSDADFVAGVEFTGDNVMNLTEYQGLGDKEKPMLFKRLED